jgi:hypothetical protein
MRSRRSNIYEKSGSPSDFNMFQPSRERIEMGEMINPKPFCALCFVFFLFLPLFHPAAVEISCPTCEEWQRDTFDFLNLHIRYEAVMTQ